MRTIINLKSFVIGMINAEMTLTAPANRHAIREYYVSYFTNLLPINPLIIAPSTGAVIHTKLKYR